MKKFLGKRLIWLMILLLPLPALSADDLLPGVRPGLVEVRSYEGNRLLTRMLGFVLDDKGHIATYLGELDRSDKISVITHTGLELLARKLNENRDARLILLQVNGATDLKPIPFAQTLSAAGRRVYSLDLTGEEVLSLKLSPGSVGQVLANRKAGEPGFIQHNALSTASGYGAPLLNNCGEVLGMNTTKPAYLVGVFENYDPAKQGAIYALSADWIAAFAESQGVMMQRASVACMSEEEKAKAAIAQVEQKAKAEIGEAKKKLSDIEKKAQAAQEQAAAAQKAREQASKHLEGMKKNLDQIKQKSIQEQEKLKKDISAAEDRLKQLQQQQAELEAKAEKQRQKAELARKMAKERENSILIISVVVAVLLLLLVVFFILRKKKAVRQVEQQKSAAVEAMQQVQSELQQKQAREEQLRQLPDVLLEGVSPEGETIAVKIAGASTGGRDGAVVGRNPSQCDYVINHPEVSRRHFRLLSVSGQLMVEDLDSTNGTRLNGEPMVPNQLEAVMNNSMLSLGELQLTVKTVS